MTDLSSLLPRATSLIGELERRGLQLATAESCTGGLLAGLFTEVSGASNVFGYGFVTYANKAKSDLLGVSPDMIAHDGAVSEHVARAMAEGAQRRAKADLALAITGIAGPGGGSPAKPVGLVHLALARAFAPTVHRAYQFAPLGRAHVRLESLKAALEMLESSLCENQGFL